MAAKKEGATKAPAIVEGALTGNLGELEALVERAAEEVARLRRENVELAGHLDAALSRVHPDDGVLAASREEWAAEREQLRGRVERLANRLEELLGEIES